MYYESSTYLIGHGVEEGAERRHDALPSRDVTVQPVGKRRSREYRRAPDVAPGKRGVKNRCKNLIKVSERGGEEGWREGGHMRIDGSGKRRGG